MMMSMLPLMTTIDLFGLVLAFIIVEHGEKLLNMGKDLSWVAIVSLSERVWKDLDLCLWFLWLLGQVVLEFLQVIK
jgi:hypothetical protein